MRILHTGDWHLGKNLEGLSRMDEQERFLEDFVHIVKDNNIDLKIGKTACCEVFDLYMENVSKFLERLPKDIIASEMEAFALFYIAKSLNKKASCILTVSDSKFDKNVVSSADREKGLTKMIELALDSALKLEE